MQSFDPLIINTNAYTVAVFVLLHGTPWVVASCGKVFQINFPALTVQSVDDELHYT